ncbi:MAG: PEP-CTERM system TPR-repeat protein PrsT [Burkholderiales bacterium]|nr:PEP-CTERM system TPR-repeat protein PrsT [Burkholderiales bacterium]
MPNPKPSDRHSRRRAVRWARGGWAALAIALMSSTWAATDPKAGKFYEDALTRFEKKDFAGAVVQLKNAIQIDRKILQVHVLLGRALLANGDVPSAEAAFDEALRLGVDRAEVVLPLARALISQGKQQQVIDQQRFVLAGLPSGVQGQLLLLKSGCYTDLGDVRSALKAIEDARAVDPDAIEPWLAEVPIRIRARQFKEGLAAVAKAQKISADAPEVHYQYGSILHVQGDLKGAIAAYDKALSASPMFVDARVARAGLMLDTKQFDAAAKDVAELLEKSPDEPRGWYLSALLAERDGKQQAVKTALARITELLDPVPIEYIRYRPQMLLLNGQAHYGLGEREKAKPFFEGFQRIQPGSPVSKLLANIYLSEKNYDRAVESLEAYLRAFPNDSQAMVLLASAHMAKGRHARAASLMQDALRRKDEPELYTAYGLSLMGAGQTANALSQLEIAYKKDPSQTQAAFALVGLYLRGNQTKRALEIATLLAARQPTNPSIQNLLGLAKARGRDTGGARAAFEQALKLDASLLEAKLNLARLEIGAQNLDRAEALINEVLKTDERNTDAMYELASLAERRSKPEDALLWLRKAYDIAGVKNLRASLALVDLHMRQGRREEALKVASEISANVPDDLSVLLALARTQIANNDTVNARTSLGTATRVAAFDAPVQVEIALLQLSVRNPQGAGYSLDKALSGKPDYLPAQVLMVDVDIRQGDLVKAEQRARQILQKEPKQAIGHSLLGDVALARKQPAQAIESYRKAYQVQPSVDTLARLFRILVSSDMKAAIQLADQWLKARPDDVSVRRMLAEAYVRGGDMASARREYERVRQLVPKDAGAINDLANVLLRMKDPQALATAEQALAIAPDNPTVIDTVGWTAFLAGQVDRSVQLLRDARLRNPASSETRYHLAAALVKTGRKGEAREELEVALRSRTPFDGRSDAEALLLTLK